MEPLLDGTWQRSMMLRRYHRLHIAFLDVHLRSCRPALNALYINVMNARAREYKKCDEQFSQIITLESIVQGTEKRKLWWRHVFNLVNHPSCSIEHFPNLECFCTVASAHFRLLGRKNTFSEDEKYRQNCYWPPIELTSPKRTIRTDSRNQYILPVSFIQYSLALYQQKLL